MPVTRAAQRLLNNENDENSALATARLGRAKSALDTEPVKKPSVRAAKAAATTTTRRRPVLGDVSNVVKQDSAEADAKEPVKRVTRSTAISRAAAPTKVTKSTSSTQRSTRSSTIAARERSVGLDARRTTRSSSRQLSTRRQLASSVEPEPETEDKENVKVDIDVPIQEETEEDVKLEVEAKKPSEQAPDVAVKTDVIPSVEEGTEDIVDIDADEDDPIMVSEYAPHIYHYLRELEPDSMPEQDYMEQQPELEWRMRGVLVDWLIEVHQRFQLLPETLFLTVNIVDRFLSRKVVQLDRLQLVGITAMFIASKYEEVMSPHINSFRAVTDNIFTEQEILRAERFMLQALSYDLSYPNPMNFLRRISKADEYNIETRTLAKYLLEIHCLDHRFLPFPPSQVAAAAMYFARLVLNRGQWDATLAYYSGYTEEELYEVFLLMVDYVRRPVVHRAFFNKYSQRKFMRASYILRQWVKRTYQHFIDPADFDRDY